MAANETTVAAALKSALTLHQGKSNSSVEDIISSGLEEGVRITNSRIGYFHLVNSDQNTIALTAWSVETLKICQAGKKDSHYPIEEAGIWVECIHQRKPVIHNNYKNSKNKKGLPDGHVPIERDMAVPVFEKDKIVAVMGVGNKTGPYVSQDTECLSLIAEAVWTIIQGKRSEEKLRNTYASLEKSAEEEKRRLEAQLQQAQKMEALGTLASGIAHDFNNILQIILGYTQMIEGEKVSENEKLRIYLDRIITGAERGRDLVKQILTFSRRTKTKKQPLQVKPIIKESIKLLRASVPSTIEIKSSIEICQNTIFADATQIHQVIMNLCTNAKQAMEKDGGILTIELKNQQVNGTKSTQFLELSPGDYIVISVGDTGIGIPTEIQEQIFNPYFTTKKSNTGTGLGLSIAHGIVNDHHGGIHVHSYPGEGSRFDVYLPSYYSTFASATPSEPRLRKGSGNILFVDDEVAIAELGFSILESLGYQVTALTDGLKALSLFRQNPNQFDLLITDQTMPKITGIELSKQVLDICPHLPIILCTGLSESVTIKIAKENGIREYINKPIRVQELSDVVHQLMKMPVTIN